MVKLNIPYRHKIPSINLATEDGRKFAPEIVHNSSIPVSSITAKMNADGLFRVLTTSSNRFCFVQRTLKDKTIHVTTFALAEDRVLKVIIKDIPILEDELNFELTGFGFNVKTVKRFGNTSRLIFICLVIHVIDSKFIDIFEVDNLFYLAV